MPSDPSCCAVTGTTGYVGSVIANYFSAHGWKVVELARRPGAAEEQSRFFVPFQLGSVDPSLVRGRDIRVLIHCAYDFRPTKWEEIHRINVEGSAQLLRSAKEAGIDKIILISSISAFDGCSSLYGKAKLAIEKVAAENGASVIRPGLVYGRRASSGLFASLQRLAAGPPIIPLIGSGQYLQYLVHEEDLCDLLAKVSLGEIILPPTPLVAASPKGWQIRDLLRVLRSASKPRLRFIPIPWGAIWLSLKFTEMLGVVMPFRSDSVISLVQQRQNPDFSTAAQIGYQFRDFKSGDIERMSEHRELHSNTRGRTE
jgi:nucleoside-diphosphate-sugar epimerase